MDLVCFSGMKSGRSSGVQIILKDRCVCCFEACSVKVLFRETGGTLEERVDRVRAVILKIKILPKMKTWYLRYF